MKPYYYVYNHGNKAPRIRHATLKEAQEEAERLAVKHPGLCFEILQCVGFSSTSKASTFWADGCGPSEQTIQETDDEWYYLKAGDEIMPGDEYENDGSGKWFPSLSVGRIVSNGSFRKYRRKIK